MKKVLLILFINDSGIIIERVKGVDLERKSSSEYHDQKL